MVADLHRSDFCDAITGRPGARSLDVDDYVILLRVEPVIHAADLSRYAGLLQLAQTGQLVAAYGVTFSLDLNEGQFAVAYLHQVGETVPHAAEVLAHRPNNCSQAVRVCAFEQGTQCADLHVLPSEDPVGLAPFAGHG